jgi:hypothetical protein
MLSTKASLFLARPPAARVQACSSPSYRQGAGDTHATRGLYACNTPCCTPGYWFGADSMVPRISQNPPPSKACRFIVLVTAALAQMNCPSMRP